MASWKRKCLAQAAICAMIAGWCAYAVYRTLYGGWNPVPFIGMYLLVGLLTTLGLIGTLISLFGEREPGWGWDGPPWY